MEICGLTHLTNLRICDSRMSPRIWSCSNADVLAVYCVPTAEDIPAAGVRPLLASFAVNGVPAVDDIPADDGVPAVDVVQDWRSSIVEMFIYQ